MTSPEYRFELSRINGNLQDYYIDYQISYNNKSLPALSLINHGESIEALFDGGIITDRIIYNNGLLTIKRTWVLKKDGFWKLSMETGLRTEPVRAFIPAVLYRENNMGSGSFPRGKEAETWAYGEERTPLPCSLVLYNNKVHYGFYKEAAEEEKYLSSRSFAHRNDGAYIRIVVNGIEKPYSYRGKNILTPSKTNTEEALLITEDKIPFSHSEIFHLFKEVQHTDLFTFYREMLATVPWNGRCEEILRPFTWTQYFESKMKHLLFLCETDHHSRQSYLNMGKNNGLLQNIYNFTSASFLVKSLEAAWILSQYSALKDSSDYLDLAENMGRFFLEGESLPGVHQDCFDLKEKKWGGYLGISENDEYRYLVNARCNGESMTGYIRLYQSLAAQGREISAFIELPKRVADFYLKNRLRAPEEGAFGRWWTKDGKSVNKLGTNGAYIVSFLLLLDPYYQDKGSLREAVAEAGEYYGLLASEGNFFGDTLDADAYDKESGSALLAMFLDLYENDKNEKWLMYAVKCADYLLTWIWQYDVPFSKKTPLGEADFHSKGMTSVSVAHHHLDFYGIAIGYDFLRLWQHSSQELYRQNGLIMIDSCRQLMATENNSLGRNKDFIGWQPEQINHTLWDYFDREDHSRGFYDINIAWVTVLGLGAYLKIRDRFPDVLSEKQGDTE